MPDLRSSRNARPVRQSKHWDGTSRPCQGAPLRSSGLGAGRGVVPGDVVLLAEGDRVPADARSLSGELELDVSALTGESAPVERLADVVDNAARTLDSPVLIFSGTGCVGGSAEAVVHATGAHTEIGRIAALAGRPGHCMRTPSRTNRSAAVRTTSAPGPVGRQPTNPHRTVGAPSTGLQRLGRKPTIDGGSFAAPH